MGMYTENWELSCKKTYSNKRMQFIKGTRYKVVEKYLGYDGTMETGTWDIIDDLGRDVSLSVESVIEYFEIM